MIQRKTAYKIAIDAIRKQQRIFAVGANLFKHGVKSVSTRNEFEKYQRFQEAIDILRQESETNDVIQKD